MQYSVWVNECLKKVKVKKGDIALDLACGKGRNSLPLAELGYKVVSVDNNKSSLEEFSHENVIKLNIDIEKIENWPLYNKKFDLIIVVNFLSRDLFTLIIDSLKKNGFLIYETFSSGHEKLGNPKRKDYLLKNRELLHLSKSLIPICYEKVETFSYNRSYIKQRVFCKNV